MPWNKRITSYYTQHAETLGKYVFLFFYSLANAWSFCISFTGGGRGGLETMDSFQ